MKGRLSLALEPADETPESPEWQGTGQKHDERFQWQRNPGVSRKRCPQATGNGHLQCQVGPSAGRVGESPKTQILA